MMMVRTRILVALVATLALGGCGNSDRSVTLQVNGIGMANVSVAVNEQTDQHRVTLPWEETRQVPANASIVLSAQLVPDANDPLPMLACVLKRGDIRIDQALGNGPAARVLCKQTIP